MHMEGIFWTQQKKKRVAIALVALVVFLIASIVLIRLNNSLEITSWRSSIQKISLLKQKRPPSTFSVASIEPIQNDRKVADVEVPLTVHVPLPDEVRGIYWTAFTAATKRADELIGYMKKTGLNSVVIDLKMDNGQIGFAPKDISLAPYAMKKPAIKDLDALLKKLADDHIYRIARIAVMRDSAFASARTTSALRSGGGGLWRDNTGSLWIDPASSDVVTYSLALAREAYARGFDEIQFDYVRFASDGRISSIVYPVYNGKDSKVNVMKRFFVAVGDPLRKEKIPVSFDLFGLVTMANDGLGIGQRLQDVMPSTDFVSPMVYPSHYANGFQGFGNPALYPYQVVKISLDHGIGLLLPTKIETSMVKNADGTETTVKKNIPPTTEQRSVVAKQFRPWIQDFDIGAVYTADKIEAQIKAARDAGASGFLLWNARNVYEPARYVAK